MSRRENPYHIAIILDGNRRWAERHGVSLREGHRQGALNLKKVVSASVKKGVKILTVYALSTENFAERSKEEIRYLLELLRYFIIRERKKLLEEGVKLNVLGDISVFPKKIRQAISETVNFLENNNKMILNVALNYGGRQEIVRAVKRIVAKKIKPQCITENILAGNLDTAGQADPDLVIRTGGQVRLSNFLLWQGSYSEWYFTDVLWPDFSGKELNKAIKEFQRRKRKFGK